MQAMAARGLPGAWGEPGSAFGTPDTDRCDLLGWEPICEESSADMTYWAWRRPLRQGLYLYRTHAVVENASAAQLRRFQHDDAARCTSPRHPAHWSSCSLAWRGGALSGRTLWFRCEHVGLIAMSKRLYRSAAQ